jgi:hypothetical protein
MKEAMKLALEALENELSIDWANNEEFNSSAEQMCDAIKALKEALAKQEQCTWVGLTDREKSNLWLESRAAIPRFHTYASLVEAKLKEKNT